jgi:hypothetical protein
MLPMLRPSTAFSKLRSAYRNSDKVTATYDEQYGFPTSVSVDVDRNAVDDEYGFGISDFVPLGGVSAAGRVPRVARAAGVDAHADQAL